MHFTWFDLVQSIVFAACTFYVRRGSKVDANDIKLNTSSVDQVRMLQAEVALLRLDVGILKDHYFDNNPKNSLDHRSPKKV